MRKKVVVIGLGYVGLPLAQQVSRCGYEVVGLDVDKSITAGLNSGHSHVDDLADADVASMLTRGFVATTEPDTLADADVVVICVPTPLADEGGPDLAAVLSSTEMIGRYLRRGMLVVLESTTYPGTTEDVVQPVLERSGLKTGTDFHLAFSPERIDPGNPKFGLHNTPKVVGGVTVACTESAVAFYSSVVDSVVSAQGTREAEMAKLLENTYRHINIALVNEMAKFCHELDIDLWDVIRCAATKPFGFHPFYPGPGVGGHCIPIDPNYLSYQVKAKLGYPFRFVELAEEINASMSAYVGRRIQDELNTLGKAIKDSCVLLLGVTYKPDIADQRESPAVPLAGFLASMGAKVCFHDPFVERWVVGDQVHMRVPDLEGALQGADVAVLLQNHSVYDIDAMAEAAQRFFDTRGVVSRPDVSRL
jgi:UDP-N-acetyl-D-glucosamine dehydrogenase